MQVRLALFVVPAVALLAACGPPPPRKVEAPAPAVEVVQARHGAPPLVERVSGTVRTRDQVTVRAEIEAVVERVRVESGATVQAGVVLVELRDPRLAEQVRAAEAGLALAQAAAAEATAEEAEVAAEERRVRALAAERLVSELEAETAAARLAAARAAVDRSRATVTTAEATLAERQAALARTVVRSPVSGRVGRRLVEPGMLVAAQDPLFVVGNLSDLVIDVPLTERLLPRVTVGQAVTIAAPALAGDRLPGRLARVSPFLDSASFRTVGEVEVTALDPRLAPGSFVTVELAFGATAPSTLVPTAALWEDPASGELAVMVVTPPAAAPPPTTDAIGEQAVPVARRPVGLLAEGGGTAAVEGVDEGDWVVVSGQHLVAEAPAARLRATSWERVLALSTVPREELLERFLARQREVARTRGAQPPTVAELLEKGRSDDG